MEQKQKVDQELSRAKAMIQNKNREINDQSKKYMQELKGKEKALKQKKKALELEKLQRQEIHRLKRERQLEKYQREKAINQDFKQRLMEKLEEKAHKANRVKERSKTAAATGMLNLTMM